MLKTTKERRLCPVCGKAFNYANISDYEGFELPPILPSGPDKTSCDNLAHNRTYKLIKRKDDTEEVIKQRLKLHY